MTDRVNPPAWKVQEDPSDLPRILRALEARFAEGREYEMSALDVAVLVRWVRSLSPVPSAELIQRIREILKGIDSDDCRDKESWWPTSTGAAFGAAKLAEVEALILGVPPTSAPATP